MAHHETGGTQDRTESRTRCAVAALAVEFIDLHGRATTIGAEFRYEAADPWAVAAVLPTEAGPVVWRFARELLTEGVFDPVGDGDVHVWPSLDSTGGAVTLVELHGVDVPRAYLQVVSSELIAFLDAAEDVVATGSESSYVDLDVLVQELLGDAG